MVDWERQLLTNPYPLPYGFGLPTRQATEVNYAILTLPGLADAYRELMKVAEQYEEHPRYS